MQVNRINDTTVEAPATYKDITEIANTVQEANIAMPVAWLTPVFTLKG
jgi:RNA-splicing ligase RtcB